MRCQPDELVIIDQNASGGGCACYFGKPFVTNRMYMHEDGTVYWIFDKPMKACVHYIHIDSWVRMVRDSMCRPIRPPAGFKYIPFFKPPVTT